MSAPHPGTATSPPSPASIQICELILLVSVACPSLTCRCYTLQNGQRTWIILTPFVPSTLNFFLSSAGADL